MKGIQYSVISPSLHITTNEGKDVEACGKFDLIQFLIYSDNNICFSHKPSSINSFILLQYKIYPLISHNPCV